MRKPVVSDHARVRFIERVLGIPPEEIDALILSDQTLNIIRAFYPKGGQGIFPVYDPHKEGEISARAVIDRNTIITILPVKD